MAGSNKLRVGVADLIGTAIKASDKSQTQIAQECGFEHPNVVSMLKQGSMKVPIARVGQIARALDLDPVALLRSVMLEYVPDAWYAIEEVMAVSAVTRHEWTLLQSLRKATDYADSSATVEVSQSDLTLVTEQEAGS
jgi:hypothetical protein